MPRIPWLPVLIVCAAYVQLAAAQTVGDRVVVVADNVAVTAGKQVVDRAYQGMVLKVREIHGDVLRIDCLRVYSAGGAV